MLHSDCREQTCGGGVNGCGFADEATVTAIDDESLACSKQTRTHRRKAAQVSALCEISIRSLRTMMVKHVRTEK